MAEKIDCSDPPERISVISVVNDYDPENGYDSVKARYVMKLDLGISDLEKACVIAQKHGREKEFRAKTENYRGNYTGENLCRILDETFVEYWGEESPKSIDQVVEPKPSMLKVAAKGTYGLARQCGTFVGKGIYYSLIGILPGDAQEKIAQKLNDNPFHYTAASMVSESGIVALGIYLGQHGYTFIGQTLILAGSLGVIVKGFASLYKLDHPNESLAVGSPLLTFPMYTALVSFYAVRAVGKWMKTHYERALQEEQQKLLPAPKEKKRIEEPKQPELVLTPDGERFETPEEIKNRLGNPIVNWPLVLRDTKKKTRD